MTSNEQHDRPARVSPTRRSTRVEQRIGNARDSLPGERNDLPDGALGPLESQGDENRPPPPNAP